jgi:hypothetical protein
MDCSLTRRLHLPVSSLLALATAFSMSTPALAGEGTGMKLTVGAKGGGSGNVLTKPDNGPTFFSAPFEEGAGGWGGGGGIFGELRFFGGHLGVETGVSLDYGRNKSTITYNDVLKTEWGWKMTSLRVPFLIQGGTSDAPGKTRFAFGVGPEISVPVSSEPILTITEGADLIGGEPADFDDGFTLDTSTQVNLLTNVGIAIPAGPLRVTVDMRYAIHFGVPKEYDERVTGLDFNMPLQPQAEVLAKWNMDLRLMVGLGYEFTLGGK